MLAQLANNENESLLKIGKGCGDLGIDDDDHSFLIQDAIEYKMAQFLQEDDHVMPSDDKNQSSVMQLPKNGSENTINKCFNNNKWCHAAKTFP
eukprot:12630394-Ditylum_brightwellii.AAC.1